MRLTNPLPINEEILYTIGPGDIIAYTMDYDEPGVKYYMGRVLYVQFKGEKRNPDCNRAGDDKPSSEDRIWANFNEFSRHGSVVGQMPVRRCYLIEKNYNPPKLIEHSAEYEDMFE
jgi:hypothetical protein